MAAEHLKQYYALRTLDAVDGPDDTSDDTSDDSTDALRTANFNSQRQIMILCSSNQCN